MIRKLNTILKGFIAATFILTGCNEGNGTGNTDTIVIDTRKEVKVEAVNLSDIADDIHVIRLETGESSLIRNFNGYVGERHIISVGQSVIHLFDASGKYISQISRRGKGPGEFNQLDAWCVDKDEKYFLYHDMGKNQIIRYDLEKLSHNRSIPFESKGSLNTIMVYDDTLLLVVPGNFGTYGYQYFFQTFDGRVAGGLEREDQPHPGAWAGMHSRLGISEEGRIMIQPSESDTVFMVSGNDLVPSIVFISDRPERYGDMTRGASNQYLFESNGMIHFMRVGYENTISPGNAMISITDVGYYIYDSQKREVCRAEPLYHELWGYELELPGLAIQEGGLVHCSLQASEFRKALRQALDSSVKGLSGQTVERQSDDRAKSKDLYDLISDDDNPVIIRGSLIK